MAGNAFLEKLAVAVTDCEASGPITLAAARVVVRAVLAAAREPSESMVRVANHASNTRAIWQAAIDEARKP